MVDILALLLSNGMLFFVLLRLYSLEDPDDLATGRARPPLPGARKRNGPDPK